MTQGGNTMEINIGKRIAYFRTSRGFSVNYLANQAGISQSYLREIEMGHYDNPSVDVLDAICGSLGISLSEFFDDQKDVRNSNDSLIEEIKYMNPEQREQLRQFLHIIRTQPYNESETSAKAPNECSLDMIVKRRK